VAERRCARSYDSMRMSPEKLVRVLLGKDGEDTLTVWSNLFENMVCNNAAGIEKIRPHRRTGCPSKRTQFGVLQSCHWNTMRIFRVGKLCNWKDQEHFPFFDLWQPSEPEPASGSDVRKTLQFPNRPAMPIRREPGGSECSRSASFDHRRRPETLRTAMATAFFCPTRTTSRLPRVTPV
jgi:hypothetical protein